MRLNFFWRCIVDGQRVVLLITAIDPWLLLQQQLDLQNATAGAAYSRASSFAADRLQQQL